MACTGEECSFDIRKLLQWKEKAVFLEGEGPKIGSKRISTVLFEAVTKKGV